MSKIVRSTEDTWCGQVEAMAKRLLRDNAIGVRDKDWAGAVTSHSPRLQQEDAMANRCARRRPQGSQKGFSTPALRLGVENPMGDLLDCY
ncbi:hypothetical protein [Streptomyces noursei]|uniref:hypothetical protein n=1 Tax=Streptomyces noursei TaxID=1971 RepID=UPI001671B61D|nr:hypothetical protein [Streptomyces noursei]